MIVVISAMGCASAGDWAAMDKDQLAGPATVSSIAGDWSDVDVSVLAAAIKMEMTVLQSPRAADPGEPAPESREYRLRSVTDESVWVLVKRTDGPAYEIAVKIGRFGDPKREQELTGWISRRLGELAGVDVRRIQWSPR